MNCRHCNSPLQFPLIDLGTAPPSKAYLSQAQLKLPEKYYPLRVLVCEKCWLVQTEDFAKREELFDADYAYFSSFSSTWLAHARSYVHYMVKRFNLNSTSHVVEAAANDGYLLQYFQNLNIPCTGIEPTQSTASAARKKGIDMVEDFFGTRLARDLSSRGKTADLIVANNVLAHVPDINDFVAGFGALLKPSGIATFEFPHLLRLLEGDQFDTIYHEHFSYLSLTSVEHIFTANGLSLFDVEEHPTHGGSLRVFAQRDDAKPWPISTRIADMKAHETRTGLTSKTYYSGFQKRCENIKDNLLFFLIRAKRDGKSVAAYGAAAKGNTLLNFTGVRPDLIQFVVDQNPAKQGKFLPGSRIPILEVGSLRKFKPDYVIILPWNLKAEIMHEHHYIKNWGGRFVTVIPEMVVL